MSTDNPPIKFYENLHLFANAICLFWIPEIHIDARFKNHPLLPDIIRHELTHYRLIKKAIEEQSFWKRVFWLLYNDIWDFIDCFRLEIKRYWLAYKRWRGDR